MTKTLSKGGFALVEFPVAGLLPWNLTTGVDGNVWFTYLDQAAVGRIAPDGTTTDFPAPGSATGAIVSALAVRFLPDPTHLIYLALIGVFALQATAIAAMRETVSPAPGALASLRPEITAFRLTRAA